MTGSEKKALDKILKLIAGGQVQNAYELLKDFLIQNPYNVDGWEIILKIAPSENEQEFADHRIKQLSPQNINDVSNPPVIQPEDYSEQLITPKGWEDQEIQLALEFIANGKSNQARKIVDEVLRKVPGFPSAVYATGLLSESVIDYRNALAELADLSKGDSDAKSYYQKLASWKTEEKRRISWRPIWRYLRIVAGGFAIFLLLIGFAIVAPMWGEGIISNEVDGDNSNENFEEIVEPDELTCEELIANALDVSDKRCDAIGTNEVCYGNYQLVTVYDGPDDAFTMEGDVLRVEALQSLEASPLNVVEKLWGVAVFKLKATIEGTIPGQNVIFLVFGDTKIDNNSDDMSAFYFSTGFSGIKCRGVDFDGLTIEMPDGYKFVFTANDVKISLEGDALLAAQPGGEMEVTLSDGSAEVTSDGVTRMLVAGTSVSIPIDENLAASGPPSEVEVSVGEQASLLCQMYGVNCPGDGVSILFPAMPPSTITPEAFLPNDSPSPTENIVPTNTPFASCGQISVRFNSYGNFQITNNSGSTAILTSMALNWPTINGRWNKIFIGGVIGSPNAETPPATHSFSGYLSNRTFRPGDSKTLTVDFQNGVKGGPYAAIFRFDNGCSHLARN